MARVTTLTKPKVTEHKVGCTFISPQAMLAWSRIPSHYKAEIISAVEQKTPISDANTKIVKVGTQVLKIQNISSGFRVVYEAGDDRNTIVSVLTPREARLITG